MQVVDIIKLVCIIIKYNYSMAQRRQQQTALQKMQDIANRLISNTPQLSKILDQDSALKPKRPFSPNSKKNANQGSNIGKSDFGTTKVSMPLYQSMNKAEMTSNDYHQKCKQLTNQLQSSRDKIFTLQQQIIIIKQRFVERQIQYRKIIQQLQQQIKCKTSLDHSDRNRMQQINQLHRQILDNIGTIQNKTSKILIEQESDIRRFFHKKINQIKEKFKEDKINKTQKDQEYLEKQKQMMSELDWIKNIAHKIDLENQTLMKKYSSLKSQYQIQEKDKDLLMKQLLMKKKQNAILKSQVQQYEKLLNEVSKQMEQNQIKNNQSGDNIMSESNRFQRVGVSKIGAGMVKGASKKQMNTINSRVSVTESTNKNQNQNQKFQNTINHLNNVIAKQRKKVRDLKALYMREVGSKSELEKIVRKLVDDVRDSIVEVERQRTRRKRTDDQVTQQQREKLLEKLLSNQKVLTLIYDKTFYSGARSPGLDKIPQQLQKILENNDQQGFC